VNRKIFIVLFIILSLFIFPPLLAPSVHGSDSQESAIRADLVKRGHPYQSFIAYIEENGSDPEYGERFDVTWHDFDSATGMTPTIFYVKKNDKGYEVVSAGTGP
jgi:hypothetical protein